MALLAVQYWYLGRLLDPCSDEIVVNWIVFKDVVGFEFCDSSNVDDQLGGRLGDGIF